MPRKVDITGQRFGLLTAIKHAPKEKGAPLMWECRCECGGYKKARTGQLRSGNTRSCGCLKRESVVHLREYAAWKNMKSRCLRINNPEYKNYGGRGIVICARWINSFKTFYSDMGEKPTSDHTIERIDVNGNYEPSNCKWATWTEQAHNQRVRKTSTTGISGVSWCRREKRWIAKITYNSRKHFISQSTDFFEACCARKSAELVYW